MNIVIKAINTIASIRHLQEEVRDVALRLAENSTHRVGRSGWAVARAEDLLALAQIYVSVAREAEAREREEERWLCSGCEEAGSILPGHFACGF